jgi:hypothetical protein
MAEKMGLISQFIASMTRPGAYRQLREETGGRICLYLLMLVPLAQFTRGVDEMIAYYQQSAPEFRFENGELTVDAEMPIVFKEPEGNAIYIIDTSGGTGMEALEDYNEGMVITRDTAVVKQNRYQQRVINLRELGGLRFNKASLGSWLPYLKALVFLILFFGWIGFICAKLLSGLWVALIGLIVFSVMKLKEPFGRIYKMAIYALTLPILLKTFLEVAGWKPPGFFLLYYAIATVYIYLAVKATREKTE